MDNKKAKDILEAFGNPAVQVGDKTILLARQSESDVKAIEDMTDDELIAEWKSLCWLNFIYGQTSVGEIQRICLMDVEIDSRPSINQEELKSWFEETSASFDEAAFHDAQSDVNTEPPTE